MANFSLKTLDLFATAPKFLSELLALELQSQGAEIISAKLAGVAFRGDLTVAYRACLWSRLANRILLPLASFAASDPDILYQGVQAIDWSQHFTVDSTFAIDFTSTGSRITHTQYGAQKVKDAIADQFRVKYGQRPSVRRDAPDVMINVYVLQDHATISIDLAGESLHKRGYRRHGGEAPLKENLAAALLLRAGWPAIAAKGGALVDVMCGSGTLPIEAALIAGNIAPGLLRTYFGFLGWKKHQPVLWQQVQQEARACQQTICSPIVGLDADSAIIKQGLSNIAQANLSQAIHLEKRELAKLTLTQTLAAHPGLVIVNPPYGERLGDAETLQYLYQNIGEQFKHHFSGWQGAVFTANPDLAKNMGIRAYKYHAFYNGTLPCRLLHFTITPEYIMRQPRSPIELFRQNSPNLEAVKQANSTDSAVQMFTNRLQKNLKHVQKWAEREDIECYRLYDADLPEYNAAIDRYGRWIHVQEYAPPKTIDMHKAAQRLEAMLGVVANILSVAESHIYLKTRQKQSRTQQYEKLAAEHQLITVKEHQAKFLVNFTDYLDTGLFIDQRNVRQEIYRLAKAKHFLNLFAYTGTASVFAALGGAASTTSVDLSATYLMWAKKNMALNGLNEKTNHFIHADCLTWVDNETRQYDLIFTAPPVFSRSKRMQDVFDIERDHDRLLENLHKNLTKNGKIIFATHKKNFTLAHKLTQRYIIHDWCKKTLPLDFTRSANSYFCWLLEKIG